MERVSKKSVITALLTALACVLAAALMFAFVPTTSRTSAETVSGLEAFNYDEATKTITGLKTTPSGNFDVVIPNGVEVIGESAFSRKNIASITLPASIKSIGNNAFYMCQEVTTVNYDGTAEQWASISFGGQYSSPLGWGKTDGINIKNSESGEYEPLTELALENISTVKAYAFTDNTKITKITIGQNVKTIGKRAFDIYNITASVYYDGTVEDWASIDFQSSYSNPAGDQNKLYIKNNETDEYDLLTSVHISTLSEIKQYAFAGNADINNVVIGSSVTKIGRSAFSGVTVNELDFKGSIDDYFNLELGSDAMPKAESFKLNGEAFPTEITVPASVTKLDARFAGLSIESVTFAENSACTEIAYKAFEGCAQLRSVTLPDSVQAIGSAIFNGCSQLAEISVPFVGQDRSYDEQNGNYYVLGYFFGSNSTADAENYVSVKQLTTLFFAPSYAGSETYDFPKTLKTVTVRGGKINPGTFSATDKNNGISYAGLNDTNSLPITTVNLGSGVTSVGNYAFYGATQLENINLSSSLVFPTTALEGTTAQPKIETEQDGIFLYVKGTGSISGIVDEYKDSEAVTLESYGERKPTSIGSEVFKGNDALKSIVIPASVTDIGMSTFEECSNLESVTFEAGSKLANLGERVFYNDYKLKSISLPEGLTAISNQAFYMADSGSMLKTVELPSTVRTIGDDAFFRCSNLNEIKYPIEGGKIQSSLETIGSRAFWYADSLYYFILPESFKSINNNAFSSRSETDTSLSGTSKTAVVFNFSQLDVQPGGSDNGSVAANAMAVYDEYYPDLFETDEDGFVFLTLKDVAKTAISSYLVDYLGTETNIVLPNSYRGGKYNIYQHAFNSNKNVRSVTIPNNSVEEICAVAFSGVKSLKDLAIGYGVSKIGRNAFKLSGLERVIINSDIDVISKYAFNNCDSLYEVMFNGNVREIERDAFSYTSLSSLNLPDSVEIIGENAFRSSEVSVVHLGKNLKKIGAYAFGYGRFSEITIPASVTEIGNGAFENCSSLTRVNFEEGSKITSLPHYLFADCRSLKHFTVPATVTTLGNTFGQTTTRANALESVTLSPALQSVGDALFTQYSKIKTVYIPSGSGTAYLSKLISTLPSDAVIVAEDKATYDSLAAAVTSDKLFYATKVRFSVTKDGKTLASETFDRLMTSDGITMAYEKKGNVWTTAENNELPSQIGVFAVDKSAWVKGEDGNYTYETDVVAVTLDTETTYTIPYLSRYWEIDDSIAGADEYLKIDSIQIVGSTSIMGTKPFSPNSYYVNVSLKEGYTWADGAAATEAKTIRLDITRYTTEITWEFDDVWSDNQRDYNGKSISSELTLSITNVKGERIILSNGLIVRLDAHGNPVTEAINAGSYIFRLNTSGYELSNLYDITNTEERRLTINRLELDLADENNLKFGLDGFNSDLRDGRLYIYNGVPYVSAQTGKGDPTIINVRSSYARYRNRDLSIVVKNVPDDAYSLNKAYTVEHTMNTGNEVGTYRARAILSSVNYRFVIGDTQGSTLERGIEIVLNADGSASVYKTWYVVAMENSLLIDKTSNEEYDIVDTDWVYGGSVHATAPELEFGDDTALKFTITYNENVIGLEQVKSKFGYYINSSMPAGDYAITFIVDQVQEVNGDDIVYHAGFSRTFRFTVAAKTDDIYAELNDRLQNQTFEHKFNPNMPQFLGNIDASELVHFDYVTRDGYWATDAALSYYSEAVEITFNVEGMDSFDYLISSGFVGNEYAPISIGTYTVYYQLNVKNYASLVDIHSADRKTYKFTVVIYDELSVPTVIDDGLVYTGSRVLPEIAESEQYEVVWTAADEYVDGGVHSVSFRLYDNVHYRWEGVEGDTVTVEFNIDKADNVFTVSLNMLGWNYEAFDAAVNNIRAATRYLDDGESIMFRIVKKGETTALSGLNGFTIDGDGKVNASVAELLNALSTGEYTLYATVNGTDNYNVLERNIDFVVSKSMNSWADGDDDLVLPSWIVGEYDATENAITVNAAHGEVNIVITDINGNEYYNSVTGVNKLGECEVGKYLLKAWVDETEDYAALAERTFTIEVLEKIGLPWWGTLLIVVGALAVAAAIIFILWKKGVFQILTGKIVLAIRTRANVDATIASVRAAKKMEEGRQSVAEAKRRERIEEMRKKAAEQRALPPEEKAKQLEEKAKLDEERAEKLRARSEAKRQKAAKMRGETVDEQAQAEAAATESKETPTEE